MRRTVLCATLFMMVSGLTGAHAQIIGAQSHSALGKGEAVTFLFPAQISVAAGKASPVDLHFRVAQGLHINSHIPSDEYLIPTALSIPDGSGAKLESASYPAGTTISLAADPKTKLSVYTGEFTIGARILATAGKHPIQARLHYQACDQNQCLPPKTIVVPIDINAK